MISIINGVGGLFSMCVNDGSAPPTIMQPVGRLMLVSSLGQERMVVRSALRLRGAVSGIVAGGTVLMGMRRIRL